MGVPFQFSTTTSIIVDSGGWGARFVEKVIGAKWKSIFIVTDPGILKFNLLQPLTETLTQLNLPFQVYSDVEADPPESIVLAATQAAVDFGADCIIAVGGGSSMDVAKLVAVLAKGQEKLDTIYGINQVRGHRLPLILVPTTAGTGSEVTPISIVTTGGQEKKGVISPVLLGDIAYLDASLTLGLPPHVTAATGVDAMVHAIESFTTKKVKNVISECLAKQALKLLSSNILTACQNGQDIDAREHMLVGAMMAGMAFANAPVGGVHALAYPIGARFHVAHGVANALVLGEVLRFNYPAAKSEYAELARCVGCPENLVGDAAGTWFVEYANDLKAKTGMPVTLRDVGIQASDLDDLADDATNQTRLLGNNPRELTRDDIFGIYQRVL